MAALLQAGTTLDKVSAPLFPPDALEVVPLYAPGGALLPTKLAQQYVGDRLFNPLTLLIFPVGPSWGAPGMQITKCANFCTNSLCNYHLWATIIPEHAKNDQAHAELPCGHCDSFSCAGHTHLQVHALWPSPHYRHCFLIISPCRWCTKACWVASATLMLLSFPVAWAAHKCLKLCTFNLCHATPTYSAQHDMQCTSTGIPGIIGNAH